MKQKISPMKKGETVKKYVNRLLVITTRKSKRESDKHNAEFLNRWLPRGSYLRQRLDQENLFNN